MNDVLFCKLKELRRMLPGNREHSFSKPEHKPPFHPVLSIDPLNGTRALYNILQKEPGTLNFRNFSEFCFEKKKGRVLAPVLFELENGNAQQSSVACLMSVHCP